MTAVARNPRLFRAAHAPGEPATLLSRLCERCGYVLFPPQDYGCDRCGSTELSARQLRARGRLLAVTTVHRHSSRKIEAPYVIGTVQLDEGPVVDAVLESRDEKDYRIGQRVSAVLVEGGRDESGQAILDLRFQTEERAR